MGTLSTSKPLTTIKGPAHSFCLVQARLNLLGPTVLSPWVPVWIEHFLSNSLCVECYQPWYLNELTKTLIWVKVVWRGGGDQFFKVILKCETKNNKLKICNHVYNSNLVYKYIKWICSLKRCHWAKSFQGQICKYSSKIEFHSYHIIHCFDCKFCNSNLLHIKLLQEKYLHLMVSSFSS